MPVKIRLARRGRKKAAMYDIVVADSRSPRDGRFIEKLGTYNPQTNPATIKFDEEKALDWVLKGAQPTDTVKAMLSYTGIMFKKHLQIGVAKGAVTQEQADARYQEWKAGKDAKITGKVEQLGSDKAAKKKANLEAEARVNAARAEAIRLKNTPEPEAVVEEETPAAEVEATEEEVATEAPAAVATEEAAPEAPAAEATDAPAADAPETPAADATEEKA